MKCFIFIGAVLRTVHLVSANALAAIEAPADTWCVTYLSTYIAAVTNQGDLPSAENSGRLPFAPSLRPTFARNTSVSITRSALSTDIGPGSALFTSDVISTADTPPIDSESSDLDADPTAVRESSAPLTLTDGLSTAVTLTTDAEPTSTSTDIIEPAGRNVIFLIQTGVNEKRSFYKRANNEFVGENNPDVCTFAAIFNLAEDEGQLFTGGLPIHYFGEDYKELSPQGRPPSGSVVSGFTDSGGTLAFRNSELPNGKAGFCQDTVGQVYITFITVPSGCTPVSLGVYNVEQCQNGRLVGLEELTSSGAGTVTATAEESFSTRSISEELPESTSLVSFESSTQASDDASSGGTSAPTVREDAETLSTVSTTSDDPASEPPTASTSEPATETSDLSDSTVTSNDEAGRSTTSGVESQATTRSETSNIETTMMTSLPETTVIFETTETTGVDTSTTEVVNDVDTTATPDTTAATDTTTTIEGDESSTEGTSDIDTTTADTIDTTTTNADTTTLPKNPTTTEAETTTAEITTTAEPTTTTAAVGPEPQLVCGDYPNPYTNSGVTFDLLCGRDWTVTNSYVYTVESFGECLRTCALNSQCNVIGWSPPEFCVHGSQLIDNGADSRYDTAKVVSRSQ